LPFWGRFVRKNSGRFPSNVFYGDIVVGLPIKPDSCNGVYCSHVLEHLSREDCRKALLNTHKILKTGGRFRFVMPDLEFCINQYTYSNQSDRALEFNKITGLGQFERPRGIRALAIEAFGNSRHRWMWDFNAMKKELCDCGFSEIRRAQFGDSTDQMFNEVEQKERWSNALGIECVKAEISMI
jgi:hypothetical protein